jgi:hypothetical protein
MEKSTVQLAWRGKKGGKPQKAFEMQVGTPVQLGLVVPNGRVVLIEFG